VHRKSQLYKYATGYNGVWILNSEYRELYFRLSTGSCSADALPSPLSLSLSLSPSLFSIKNEIEDRKREAYKGIANEMGIIHARDQAKKLLRRNRLFIQRGYIAPFARWLREWSERRRRDEWERERENSRYFSSTGGSCRVYAPGVHETRAAVTIRRWLPSSFFRVLLCSGLTAVLTFPRLRRLDTVSQ